MRYVKWIFRALFLGILIAFLHYTLPQTDIVRITNTYEKRVDFQGYEMFWADGARDAAGNLLNSTTPSKFIWPVPFGVNVMSPLDTETKEKLFTSKSPPS